MTVSYANLLERVGRFLFGQRSGYSDSETSDIEDAIRDGLRTVYAAHDWSFFKPIQDISAPYYLRFTVVDKPGVLSRISGILGDLDISILSVIQKGRKSEKGVYIYMLTHEAREKNMRKALQVIDQLPVIVDKTVLMRIEDPSNLEG